jgi:hypothetical protein
MKTSRNHIRKPNEKEREKVKIKKKGTSKLRF